MRPARFLSLLILVPMSMLLASCLGQFDPTRFQAQWHREWQQSVQPSTKLTATGELPPAGGPVSDINERFTTLCSSCHGPQGMGDGPGSVALNPKPRNFHDKNWQAATADARIVAVITNGGGANGLSAVMPPWGSTLSSDEINRMVQKIRAFGKQ